MKILKRLFCVLLLLGGLFFALIAVSVLSDPVNPDNPRNWLGVAVTSSIGLIGLVSGIYGLVKLSRRPRDVPEYAVAPKPIAKRVRKSPSMLAQVFRGMAVFLAAMAAKQMVKEAVAKKNIRNYYCKKCGSSNTVLNFLVNSKCSAYSGNHVLYQGSEKDKYVCEYCGLDKDSIFFLVSTNCRNHPAGVGKHSPAL